MTLYAFIFFGAHSYFNILLSKAYSPDNINFFLGQIDYENKRYAEALLHYNKIEYETFENTGEKSWPAGYNPKPLLAKSIREEAAKYLQTKLTLRRV